MNSTFPQVDAKIERLSSIINKEIADIIEINKKSHRLDTDRGVVVSFADGVAIVEGISSARIGQRILLPKSTERAKADSIHNEEVFGQIMDIESEHVECIIFGEERFVKEGDTVELESNSESISTFVSDALLGKVVDPFGRIIDVDELKEPASAKKADTLSFGKNKPIESDAPPISMRAAVNKPLQTGIRIIDAALPIGRGQRMLVIGDRGTGKTSLALTIIKNQALINKDLPHNRKKIFIYVAIGKKISEVVGINSMLRSWNCMDETIIVLSKANDPASLVYITPFSATTIAEYFRDMGRDVVIVYDDLSSHANAYRHISLLLRRPPGREAYPGDIFYLHSRLLERASNIYLKQTDKGLVQCSSSEEVPGRFTASITAFPIVQTKESDFNAYIPTNIISITDGQIYLDTELANNKIMPAVNIGLSVSRIGSAAQNPLVKTVSRNIKYDLARYNEKVKFTAYGFDLDEEDTVIVNHGKRLIGFCKQPEFDTVSEEALIIDLIVIYTLRILEMELIMNLEETKYAAKDLSTYDIIIKLIEEYDAEFKFSKISDEKMSMSGFKDRNMLINQIAGNAYLKEQVELLRKKYVKH